MIMMRPAKRSLCVTIQQIYDYLSVPEKVFKEMRATMLTDGW
jgi:hypothetical protein